MNFQFQDNPKITKELILSKISEESIFTFYFNDVIRSKKLYKSKLRSDHRVTVSFYRNPKGTLIYHDFATGEFLDCFSYVMKLFGCNYFEALKIIANDFNIIKNNNIKKNNGKINLNPIKVEDKKFTKLQIEIQSFSDLELKWWEKYGVTKEILEKFNVYSCKHVFLNDQLCASSKQNCPIYGYFGGHIKENGNKYELWRIYFPKRRDNYRFLANWPAKKIQGYEYLPKKGNLLCITKSMKDVLTLYSLGISAIAPNSETLFISDKILDDLKNRFKHIVVLYDTDLPGLSNMKKIKKEHPELIYTWIPRKYNTKDISDFYREYNKKKTLNLIKSFVLWLKEKN